MVTAAAAYKPRGSNSPHGQNSRFEEKVKVWCDYCNKPRHTRATCWKIHGKPQNWKGNRSGDKNSHGMHASIETETSSPSLSKEQLDQIYKIISQIPTSSSGSGFLAKKSSFSIASTVFSNLEPWIIDSSASDHMTNSSHFFTSYTTCSGNLKICIADGSLSPIAGKGSITISNDLTLKSVLHVPKLLCNLLSVSKLTKDSNCLVKFYDSYCEFQDHHSKKMIGSARMVDGLYYFDDSTTECG